MKKNIALSVILIALTVILVLYMKWDDITTKKEVHFSTELTLKQLAKKNDIRPKELLYVLSLKDSKVWDLSKDVPVKDLDVDSNQVREALEHIKGEGKPALDGLKYVLWAIWISLILILVLSRKKIKSSRIVILLLAVVIFGLLLGATPNPMESMVKLFKMLNNMEGGPKVLIVSFILFSLFSVLGAKLICSWGCQLGALQESIFNIPVYKNKYKFQFPFAISLAVRLILFILFFLLLFGIALGIKNFVIYHHVNYFKIFSLDLATFALYSLPVFVLASLFIFRPFCQFICPFGLYAWLLENIAINRVRVIEDKCIECLKCVKDCPTQAMKGIYEKKRKYFLPDCWSCGICVEVCPTDAVEYGKDRKNFSPEAKALDSKP